MVNKASCQIGPHTETVVEFTFRLEKKDSTTVNTLSKNKKR